MKKFNLLYFYLSVLAILLFSSCNSNEEVNKTESVILQDNSNSKNLTAPEKTVGVNDNGTFRVTASNTELKEIFDNSLKQANVTATLVNYEIKKDVVEGSTDMYYYLIASNADGDVKVATVIILKSNNSFAAKMSLNLSNTFSDTCTCSGSYTKGCDPRHWVDHEGLIAWRCSSCTQKNKTCNKSVSDSL